MFQRTIFQPKAEVTRITSSSLQSGLYFNAKSQEKETIKVLRIIVFFKLQCSIVLVSIRIQTESGCHEEIGVD